MPSGYGIRHLVFSKDGKYIYAVNELVPAISVFEYANGKAKLVKTEKIDCYKERANGAAIRLSGDGKFLYVSCRVENKIFVYSVNGSELALLQDVDCGGDSPRDFNLCGNYLIVSNEKSGNVVVYLLENGIIKNKTEEIEIPSPLCVVI